MATSYPTSKQTLTNPTSTTDTSAVSHANQHATINDTVAALEDTVGYSADTSSSVLGKLSGITGSDIAAGVAATQTFTNKSLTSPKLLTSLKDSNGATLLLPTATTSAVNNVTLNNAATGNTPGFTASGTDSNINIQVIGKGNGLTKASVLRQDITTNSYKHNTVILSGWGFILGNAGATMSQAVTFGKTFAAAPVVITTGLNAKTASDPTSIGDFTTASEDSVVGARSITTSGFTVSFQKITGTFGNTVRFGYSWMAIGELT